VSGGSGRSHHSLAVESQGKVDNPDHGSESEDTLAQHFNSGPAVPDAINGCHVDVTAPQDRLRAVAFRTLPSPSLGPPWV
jgi:hypothetical protein